jgi:hypothetical protein
MRQLFTSQRLENVEAVAKLLNEAGIETWVSEARSYKGNRRRTFSYKEHDRGGSQPGVWIVKADDVTRARSLLIEAGLLESTKPDSYLPAPPPSHPGADLCPAEGAARGSKSHRPGLYVSAMTPLPP